MEASPDLGRLLPAEQPRILRVRVLSRRVRIVFWGLIGFLLVFSAISIVLTLLGVSGWSARGYERSYDFSGVSVDFRLIDGWREWPLRVLAGVPVAIGLAVIWQLDRLLAAYQKGVILTARNALRIRRVGLLLLAWCVAEFCIGLVAGVLVGVLRLGHAAEPHAMALNLEILLAGSIVLIVGHAMRAASVVAEEAALTV